MTTMAMTTKFPFDTSDGPRINQIVEPQGQYWDPEFWLDHTLEAQKRLSVEGWRFEYSVAGGEYHLKAISPRGETIEASTKETYDLARASCSAIVVLHDSEEL